MTRALVLSGGGNLGAVQAGMLIALEEAGVRPDFIVGTSVGALNGAWMAGGRSAEDLGDLWRTLHRSDVFPVNLIGGFLGFIGERNHLVSNGSLRRLLQSHLTFERMEEAAIPFHVVATDVLSGHDVRLSSGPCVDAVLASAAIPGVFPTVKVGDFVLMDGGIANNTPISHAAALGADEIWVLSTGHSCALTDAPGSALGMALHAFNVAIEQRLALDVLEFAERATLRVVPPLCPVDVVPTDFSQADRLITAAHRQTVIWMQHQGLDGTGAEATNLGHQHP
jgi:NTE family protein